MSDLILPGQQVWDNSTALTKQCCSLNGLHAMPVPLAYKLSKAIATMVVALSNDKLDNATMEKVMREAGGWAADDDVRAWVSLIMRISENMKV